MTLVQSPRERAQRHIFMNTIYGGLPAIRSRTSSAIYNSYIEKSRFTQYYVVMICEPRVYPDYIPRSFAYWRHQVDLLAPDRISSVIYDKQTGLRKLKYIYDDSLQVYGFLRRIKRTFPNINLTYYRYCQYY